MIRILNDTDRDDGQNKEERRKKEKKRRKRKGKKTFEQDKEVERKEIQ